MTDFETTPTDDHGDDRANGHDAPHVDEPGELAASTASRDAVIGFEGLRAPPPVATEPPASARWLAFASILIGGGLGGLIGYGTADLMADSSVVAALGGLLGAVIGAVGVGIVAGLTLRAMNEWNAVAHPEAATPDDEAEAEG